MLNGGIISYDARAPFIPLPVSTTTQQEEFVVTLTQWRTDGAELAKVRREVFVLEHSVPEELESDADDPDSARVHHAVARDSSGNVIGTGRIVLDDPVPRIGRMAIRKEWRGRGVGAAVLELLCEDARRAGFGKVMVHSQTHTAPFYFKRGFLSYGTEFYEAGIPHQQMRRKLG